MNSFFRVFYIPNETASNSQVGIRRAFAAYKAAGHLDVMVFSMLRRVQGGSVDEQRVLIDEAVARFQPTHILLQHADGMGLTPTNFRNWKRSSDATIIYHEADPYGVIRNRTPWETLQAARHSDVTLLTGSSSFAFKFRVAGARDVRWIFQGYDSGSFGRPPSNQVKTVDAVMVANRGHSRVPYMGHPGSADRTRFVRLAQQAFGRRLALYGNGWTGASARGPVDFWGQGQKIGEAWISMNWDHYPRERGYFSNRLAISLASGSVHFTTWHPGYDEYFPAGRQFIQWARSPEELISKASDYLDSSSVDQRRRDIQAGMEWAHDNLRQDDLLQALLASGGVALPRKILGADRNASTEPMTEW